LGLLPLDLGYTFSTVCVVWYAILFSEPTHYCSIISSALPVMEATMHVIYQGKQISGPSPSPADCPSNKSN